MDPNNNVIKRLVLLKLQNKYDKELLCPNILGKFDIQ